jgi:squalene-associated FAD-dependent desaturase
MAPSFLLLSALSFADKRAIGNALLAIARAGGRPKGIEGLSMQEWLVRMRQTRAAIERFWRVVLVSALDEELSRTDARYGIDVFWKGFLANREGYRVGIPSVPLAKLYDGCRETIQRQGGDVRLRCGVRQIRAEGNRFVAAQLEDGSEMNADACVLAVPQDAVSALLQTASDGHGALAEDLRRFKVSPITGVHLWFDRTVMTEPFLTLLSHTTQWIFNKSALTGENKSALPGENQSTPCAGVATNGAGSRPTEGTPEPAGSQYLQLVISASYALVPKSRQEIIDLCLRELGEVLPRTREARLVKGTVVKEVNATFSPEPGVDRWRPGAADSGIRNLFLAGDWTRTGWPATMEGAVRSGYLAAESLLSEFGQPRMFLRPDLPPEGLCKIWARRRVSESVHRSETDPAPKKEADHT